VYARDLNLGRQEHLYGLFKSAKEARDTLINLAKEEALCTVTLGLEKGTLGKPCFARQLKRCRGACVGEESIQQHSIRVMEVLHQLKLKAWPFKGAAILAEGSVKHVIDAWCYLGTARTDEEVWTMLEQGTPSFDKDTYRILVKQVNKMRPLATQSSPKRNLKSVPKLVKSAKIKLLQSEHRI
jgi:DNA polymerase-3 subunit epsilon